MSISEGTVFVVDDDPSLRKAMTRLCQSAGLNVKAFASAGELGASEQTIKVHRGRVMEKMGVASVAELVQAAVKAGVVKP